METDFEKWGFGQNKPKPPTESKTEEKAKETTQEEADVVAKKTDDEVSAATAPLKTASKRINDLDLWWKTLMATVAEKHVTDIHFHPEKHEALVRTNTEVGLYQHIGRDDYDTVIRHLIPKEKQAELEKVGQSDFAVTCFGRRMRVNVYKTLKGLSGAFRPLPNKSIPWKDNGLSEAMMKVIETTKQGLILVTGPTGSGKSLGYGTPVIKFDGSVVPVESLKIGDLLMGPDSKPRTVTQTQPGRGKMYKIIPKAGEAWFCNDAHIMTLKRSIKGQKLRPDGRKRNDGEYQAFGEWFRGAKNKKRPTPPQAIVDVNLQEFLDRTPKNKNPSQHWKLFRTGVDFATPSAIAKIDTDHFYYLGLWLGDGTLHANSITNLDKAVIQWVEKYAKKNEFSYREASCTKRNPEIKRIGASQNIGRAHNRMEGFPFIIGKKGEKFCLKSFLGCCVKNPGEGIFPSLRSGSGEKTIPLWAKTASRSQRLALLAGLLDTDGSLGSNCFDFTNKGKPLVDALIFIARSLGLWASPAKEKIVNKKSYWRTCISGNTDMVPTKIQRKQASPRKQKKDALVTGWQVKDAGNDKYFGILLDGDGRFLLGDFTVTHNSTTLCSMLEFLNEKYPYHVITIEDPIEYIFQNKRCIINQREVGEHTESFQSALRASLRENPDIIFVGEMRDYETARTALMAADTGHLVFGTLHTRRVYSTVSRLLEMAPESSRSEMRAMLSSCLSMVICQRLLQKRGGGIWPCREVMMLNPAISSLIKEGKEKGISNQLTINQAKGMVEWGKALEVAEKSGLITPQEAETYRDSTEDVD